MKKKDIMNENGREGEGTSLGEGRRYDNGEGDAIGGE